MARKKRDEIEEMLVRLFGSTSRPRILGLLISHPQQAFYQREIVYETGLSLQTVQRELKNLLHLGVLKKREEKAKVYYQIDSSSPWFNPLKEIYTTYVQFLLSKKHPPHPNPPPRGGKL